MKYKCGESGCGVDMTDAVERAVLDKLAEPHYGLQYVLDKAPERTVTVVLKCQNGHRRRYAKKLV